MGDHESVSKGTFKMFSYVSETITRHGLVRQSEEYFCHKRKNFQQFSEIHTVIIIAFALNEVYVASSALLAFGIVNRWPQTLRSKFHTY